MVVMRAVFLLFLTLALVGCREVRVNTAASGIAYSPGSNAIEVIRNQRTLDASGIKAPFNFSKEFAVILFMGPHKETGYTQFTESIRANIQRVRVVAFERQSLEGGAASKDYRTYTCWRVPNSAYRAGSILDVVTPSGDLIVSTTLR